MEALQVLFFIPPLVSVLDCLTLTSKASRLMLGSCHKIGYFFLFSFSAVCILLFFFSFSFKHHSEYVAWATLNKLWPVETWRYLQSRVERYRSTVESLVKPTHSCGMPLEEMEQTAFFALKVKAKPPRPPPPLSPSLPESLSLCGTLPTPNRPDCYCLENTTLPCGREFPSVLDAGVYLQITKKMLQPLVSVCVESDFFFW